MKRYVVCVGLFVVIGLWAEDGVIQDVEGVIRRGNDHFAMNQYDEAIDCYKSAFAQGHSSLDAHYKLGVSYARKQQTNDAIEEFRAVVMENPCHALALTELGKIGHAQQQYDTAVQFFLSALSVDQSLCEAHIGIARIYYEQCQYALSAQQYKILLQLEPHNPVYLFEYANALNMANNTDDAFAVYRALDQRFPGNPSIIYNLAYTLKKMGRIQDAIPYYEQLLQKEPDHAEGNFSLGLAYLLQGNFTKGWEKYEWRWKRNTQVMTQRVYDKPLWDGSSLYGKTIFLYAEQGLGDTFQFIRYAREAKRRGGKVVVAVQHPLVSVLSLCDYIDHVLPINQEPAFFDCYAPLVSLPYILQTTIDTVPNEIPYLRAKQDLVKVWHDRLKDDKNFKVGICWQGNSNYSTALLRSVVAAKSMKIDLFAPLFSVPGVSIYSLQKETGMDQLNRVQEGWVLHTFDETFDANNGRFMDTAAVMKNLDLVISVDTGTAHLAAGLGVPTWILIPEPPDWRWMLHRTDTPWYPNVRLFRQREVGNWPAVMETVAHELAKHISKNRNGYDHDAVVTVDVSKNIVQKKIATIETQLLKNIGVLVDEYTNDHSLDSLLDQVHACYLLGHMRDELKQCSLLLDTLGE